MTVEADIYNTVKTLVSNRVYPDLAPNNATMPYITYQQVGGEVVNYVEPSVADLKNGFFQVNVWCTTRAQAASLILQIEQAIVQATVFSAKPLMAPIAGYDEDGISYGMLQQFSIWSAR